MQTGQQWAYLAIGSSLAGVPGINKCSSWCSKNLLGPTFGDVGAYSFCFDDIWPKQEQQEMGAEALTQDFIASVAVVLQQHHKFCSPGCSFEAPASASMYSIFIDPYLNKQLVLLLGLSSSLRGWSAQPMFFPPAQKYTLIKNVSRQLALVCVTKGSSALLWRGKGIPVTEEFVV